MQPESTEQEAVREPETATGNDPLQPAAPRAPQGVIRGDRGTESAQVWMSGFLVLVAGIFIGSGAWQIPFHGQELSWMVDSDSLHRLVTFPEAISLQPDAPLSLGRIAAAYGLFGLAGLRLMAVLFHALNALLVFFLAQRLLAPERPVVSMLAGLVFAAHPLAVGVLGYLPSWAGSQGLFFALASIVLYLRGTAGPTLRVPSLAVAFAAYLAACGSLLGAAFVPLFLMAAQHVVRPQRWDLARPVQFAFLALFAGVMVAQGASGVQSALQTPEGLLDTIRAQGNAAWQALAYFITISSAPLTGASASAYSAVALLLLAGASAAGLWMRSVAGLAALWTLLAAFALPCLSSSTTLRSTGAPYFTAALLPLLFSWVALRLATGPPRLVLTAVTLLLAAVAAWKTLGGVAAMQDPFVFWLPNQEAAEPESRPEPWYYAARASLAQANVEETAQMAQPHLETAANLLQEARDRRAGGALEPEQQTQLLFELGTTLARLGRTAPAAATLQDVLRENPAHQQAAMNLGLLYEGEMRANPNPDTLRKALAYLRRADALGPMPAAVLVRYAMAAGGVGDYARATMLLQRAEAQGAGESAATARQPLEQLASTALQLEQQGNEALAREPSSPEGIVKLAEARLIRGESLQALYLLDRVLQRDARHAQAWPLMGVVKARMNDAAGFIAEWGQARAGQWEAWREVARRTAASGLWDAALAYANEGAAGTGVLPEVALAGIALEQQQTDRADALLRSAAEKYPESPAPWVARAGAALAQNDKATAAGYVAEAEKRGAAPEALAPLREQIGTETGTRPEIPRTVIR